MREKGGITIFTVYMYMYSLVDISLCTCTCTRIVSYSTTVKSMLMYSLVQ